MKVMATSAASDDGEQEAFNREARAVAQLRHPYVVAIHEVGKLRGVQYYTMDYIEGLPLQTAVTSEGLTPRALAEIFVKICDAVDYAHSQGILHRDIKPQNIMIDEKHNPVLIDFGIASRVGEADDEQGQIVGSPAYLPPEYISGDHGYDVLGEVYSLGASLYAVLAGRPPHTGIDTVQMLRRATREKVVPLRRVQHSIDERLEAVVMTALSRDARRRYPSAQDMGNDLRRYLEGDEITGDKGPLGRAWSRVRGRVAASFGLALALILVVMSLGYSLTLSQQRKGEESRSSQFERERQELREQLLKARLENARLHFQAKRYQKAEATLTLVLQQKDVRLGMQAEAHQLRAQVRDAMGDAAGAADDLERAHRIREVQ
jgi:serine/threonine protein kinase